MLPSALAGKAFESGYRKKLPHGTTLLDATPTLILTLTLTLSVTISLTVTLTLARHHAARRDALGRTRRRGGALSSGLRIHTVPLPVPYS